MQEQTDTNPEPPSIWAQELDDLFRAVSGAMLFGIPLLYTMEVWWIGSYTPAAHLFAGLLLTFLVLIVLNRSIGFRRQGRDRRWRRTLTESVETLAIGLLIATLAMFLLRRLSLDLSLETILGRVILEGIPFSIGAGIATGLLGEGGNGEDEGEEAPANEREGRAATDQEGGQRSNLEATLVDVGSTILGALVFVFSIAPTGEVSTIAASISYPWLLLLMGGSLLISYIIVFEAGFGSQQARRQHEGFFQHPVNETLLAYLIALALSAVMLLFFQLLTPGDPLSKWLSHTIVLGLPAAVGGAAGRVVV